MHFPEVNNRQSPWSFNHRTRAHEAFDLSESSDSESQAEIKSNIPSDDTKLFRQLDISSRHETVEYKPNPWSIARINAASRAPNIKETSGPTLSEHSRQKSHQRAPQGRIVDAFKVQAERKPPRAPVPSKALQIVKPKSNTFQVSRKDQLCIPGKSSVEPGEHSQLVNASFFNSVSQRRSSRTPILSSATQEELCDLRFQSSPHILRSSSSNSECGSISINAELTCQRSVAHISTSNTPVIFLSSAPRGDLPSQRSQHRCDISTSEEPTSQRGIAHISTSDTNSRCNVPFLSRSSPPIGSDYPLHASYLRPEGYQSSPPRPSHRNVYTPQRLLTCTPVNQSFSHRRDVRITGNQRTASEVLAKDSCPIVRPLGESEPSSMPQWLVSTMHSSPQSQSQSEHAEIDSSSVRYGFVSLEPRKRPRRSSTPSPSPQRTQSFTPKCNDSRPSAPYAGPVLPAYAFDDDPDANWSTITKPTKKNSRNLKPSVAWCSGPFRLPAPAVGNSKGESKGVTRTEKKQGIKPKRRVITYLPPPPSQPTVAPSEIMTQVGEYCALDDGALHLRSPPGARPPQEGDSESPILQADSDDLTLVGEVDEQVLIFDAGEVKARYPKIRKLAKESLVTVSTA
ncbi:hypothetical protein AZE42_10837 [Rhizopogon vesiculosus]|uniref:Uncharacterized protein n=1 Tax=Rhizopogon vesiculosus TaxID=180088 RepID=A0A1J8QCC6_9AGAM|nr:hypothetical protein AZE42_10837 [Rhizopogon vesiculosus]